MTKEELKNRSKYIRINITSSVPFEIDLTTHKVAGWKEEYGSKSIFEKVVDQGVYSLLDENKNEIYRIEGYVPNDFLPEKDGYGDYLTLEISKDGTVINWYEDPDFQEFIEQGYSPLPITSPENIHNVIYNFFLPLAKHLAEQLTPIVKDSFYIHSLVPQLSLKANTTHRCLEITQCKETNNKMSDYALYLQRTKSLWLDFYVKEPIYSNVDFRFCNIWTDIELYANHITVNAIHKDFSYAALPSVQDIDEIAEMFKQTLHLMIQHKIENKKYLGGE